MVITALLRPVKNNSFLAAGEMLYALWYAQVENASLIYRRPSEPLTRLGSPPSPAVVKGNSLPSPAYCGEILRRRPGA